MPAPLTIARLTAACLLCASVSLAADNTRPADIESAVRDLASTDWDVRQRGYDRLVNFGDDAVGRLSQLAAGAVDDEIRSRATAALAQIEQNRRLGQTPITLKVSDVPAAQAFAELMRQARGTVAYDPPNLLNQKSQRRVSLNVEREPFWSVMQSLCAQSELEVTQITRGSREMLGVARGTAEWMDKPIVLAGPLLVRADRVVRTSNVRLKPPRQTIGDFNISFSVFAEPKLKVLDFSSSVHLDRVLDDKGNSLMPSDDQVANAEVFGNAHEAGTSNWAIGASLHYPKGAGAKIAQFKGRATLLVQTQSATLDVPVSKAKGTVQTVGGLRITVKAVEMKATELSIARDGRDDAEWYAVRMQLSAAEARLLNEQGQVVARRAGGWDIDDAVGPGGGQQRMDVKFRLAREAVDDGMKDGGKEPGAAADGKRKGASAEPVTFQFQFPTETTELSVPFEFRDLPIP